MCSARPPVGIVVISMVTALAVAQAATAAERLVLFEEFTNFD
jgi:hypothetical protein